MFQELLEKTALALDERSIPYTLIGGQAVLLYGEPRLTKDIDITLGVGPERLADVAEMVEGFGWKVLVEKPQEFVRETMVLPCSEPLGVLLHALGGLLDEAIEILDQKPLLVHKVFHGPCPTDRQVSFEQYPVKTGNGAPNLGGMLSQESFHGALLSFKNVNTAMMWCKG